MRRVLVVLNLCGCEAVWYKLKNTLKTQKTRFLPVFELMSDSLTATKVEYHQCPSHQSILLTQGPIHEIFMKNHWELAELENEVFLRRPFWIFESAILNFFFASSHWKIQPFYMRYHFFLHYGWFFQNLRKEAVRTFMHTTVVLILVCTWFYIIFLNIWCLCWPWISLNIEVQIKKKNKKCGKI